MASDYNGQDTGGGYHYGLSVLSQLTHTGQIVGVRFWTRHTFSIV